MTNSEIRQRQSTKQPEATTLTNEKQFDTRFVPFDRELSHAISEILKLYQLAFLTPGSSPRSASSLNLMRHMPNLLMTLRP